eukprot:PhM_4_TR19117/c0_g1_i1/m.52562
MAILNRLLRRKVVPPNPLDTPLNRVLGLFDLTVIGIGSTLGTGVYTLLGKIAHDSTGPAIVISFLFSGFASILSGLCYSEFASRVPRAGSAYLYSYVTMGEGVAWFTGWQLLLEYIIGCSSVAKGLTNYLDALANGAIVDFMNDNLSWGNVTSEISPYPDLISAAFIMLIMLLVIAGVKESALLNNTLTSLNAAVILFTVCLGSRYADTANFTDNFAPYGVTGIFQGASTAFFCYVGFDVIATAAEEAKNPRRDLPLAIIGCLCFCCVGYMASSGIVTMMQPYDQIDKNAPLAIAFSSHGVYWAKNIVAVGAVCGCFSSLLMGAVPMPRITYAIATDGLVPIVFAKVHPRFHTPYVAALSTGALAALLAMIFPYDTLVNMMSLGTLMAYTAVCMSVLILRYREYDEEVAETSPERLNENVNDSPRSFHLFPAANAMNGRIFLWNMEITACTIAVYATCVFFCGMCCVSVSLLLDFPSVHSYVVMSLGLTVMIYCTVLLAMTPRRIPLELNFIVPYIPFLPLVAIMCNAHLLVNLPVMTWVRFGVWCLIGGLLYYFYGQKNSVVEINNNTALCDPLASTNSKNEGSSESDPLKN